MQCALLHCMLVLTWCCSHASRQNNFWFDWKFGPYVEFHLFFFFFCRQLAFHAATGDHFITYLFENHEKWTIVANSSAPKLMFFFHPIQRKKNRSTDYQRFMSYIYLRGNLKDKRMASGYAQLAFALGELRAAALFIITVYSTNFSFSHQSGIFY